MRIAIIPARGGSKRIPNKNVRCFYGKPIIAYSIEAAQNTNLFDQILVSTDDAQIAEISSTFGAICPFVRPPELSDDFTGTTTVVSHAVNWLRDNGTVITTACCIYATAPLILSEDIIIGLEMLEKEDLDYVFAITRFAYPPQRGLRLNHKGRPLPMFHQFSETRSQDLEPTYHDAGQFYWGTFDAWSAKLTMFSERSGAVELPHWRVHDIDTLDDWAMAEHLFALQRPVLKA